MSNSVIWKYNRKHDLVFQNQTHYLKRMIREDIEEKEKVFEYQTRIAF